MQPMRQGDVILLPTQIVNGQKLPHLTIAEGTWMIRIQREYEPEDWRYVAD